MKQKKLFFNFFVNRNWKKLTDSRKKAKILSDNRKSHHPIETLLVGAANLQSPVMLENFCLTAREHKIRMRSDVCTFLKAGFH